jgi:glutamine amidotransferase
LRTVSVVDYGVGNLYSVARALEHCGAAARFVDSAGGIDASDALVLPGVGAFGAGMRCLQERGLVEPLRRHARSGRPLLGICLGMQMLFETGTEFGRHEGLGLLPGEVVPLPARSPDGGRIKVPRVGWSELLRPDGRADWSGTTLAGVAQGAAVYFVHSFHAVPTRPLHRIAECGVGGHRVAAVVGEGAVTGCQFHPEKSGAVGLAVLAGFVQSAG